MAEPPPPDFAAILAGDRRSLSRAITLVESTRTDHRAQAEKLLSELRSHRPPQLSLRIGVSGPPGAGKSSVIERLGLEITRAGRSLAVLTVDPSSSHSGGSILGDKTRMEQLATSPLAFIRPFPAGGSLGGVTRRLEESLELVEAAGFRATIVETVGVGQSEMAVANLTDLLILTLPPASGDELQGIKRGIVERADLIIVNKCDGETRASALRTVADYAAAIHLRRPNLTGWQVPVFAVSALTGEGITPLWQEIQRFSQWLQSSNQWQDRRGEQAVARFPSEVMAAIAEHLAASPELADEITRLEAAIRHGTLSPAAAAQTLLNRLG
ncbi:MAG: methylmalonyl Co-A mutase-associated GTPase MeaB [Alphaproteobacteria bacterium]|nr:methylmalonyl Co-A mutase-associated GTPase MeaB [Alphaproteobacteria bacterium]